MAHDTIDTYVYQAHTCVLIFIQPCERIRLMMKRDFYTSGSSMCLVGEPIPFAKIVVLQPPCPAYLLGHNGTEWIQVTFTNHSPTVSRSTAGPDGSGKWWGFEQPAHPAEAKCIYDLPSSNPAWFRHDARFLNTTTAWISRTAVSGYPQIYLAEYPRIIALGSVPIILASL